MAVSGVVEGRFRWVVLSLALVASLLAVSPGPAGATVSGSWAAWVASNPGLLQFWRLGEPAGSTVFPGETPPSGEGLSGTLCKRRDLSVPG